MLHNSFILRFIFTQFCYIYPPDVRSLEWRRMVSDQLNHTFKDKQFTLKYPNTRKSKLGVNQVLNNNSCFQFTLLNCLRHSICLLFQNCLISDQHHFILEHL